jgi:hypothetical protein
MACFVRDTDVHVVDTIGSMRPLVPCSPYPMYRGQGSRFKNRGVGVEKQYSGLAEEHT